jgi:hypothetical protein
MPSLVYQTKTVKLRRGSAGPLLILDLRKRQYYCYIMREHMSITLEKDTARRLRRYALRERRPVSQVVEIAIERLLQQQMPVTETIVTTRGSFKGSVSREETYEGR